MENLYQEIGKRIRTVRLQKGLTLEQLSEKCDRDWAYISQVERGKDIPSIETLRLVCNALGISMCKLFDVQRPTKAEKYAPLTMKIIAMVNECSSKDKKRIIKILQQVLKK